MRINKESAEKHPIENRSRITQMAAIAGSFLGALFLWIYAIGYDSTLFERTFNGVEVVFEGESELSAEKGLTLPYRQETFSITIVAKGKRSELNALEATDFKAVIDISKAEKAGEQTFDIVVHSPNGIEVVDQSSETATVLVDEFTVRPQLLNVNPDKSYYTTKFAEDVVSYKYDINPKTVVVEGPKSMLDDIAEVYVNFDLEGKVITDDIKGWGAIELLDHDGNVINNPYIKLSETTGYFMIEVVKEKTVPVKYAFAGEMEFQPLQSVTLSQDSIKVQGPSSDLASFNEYIITIDETTIGKNTVINHLISLPDKISRSEGTPSEIKVKVDLRGDMTSKRFWFDKNMISVRDLPEGTVCNVKDGVSVTVVGLKDVISQMKRENIKVALDFGKRTPNPDGSFSSGVIVEFTDEFTGAYALKENIAVKFNVYYK